MKKLILVLLSVTVLQGCNHVYTQKDIDLGKELCESKGETFNWIGESEVTGNKVVNCGDVMLGGYDLKDYIIESRYVEEI